MKLTKKLIEQMVREAVKQYAVDPEQFFSVSPNDPQYAKLKDLAKTDVETAKMLRLQSGDQQAMRLPFLLILLQSGF